MPKGKWVRTPEFRQRMAVIQKGKHHGPNTEEWRKKLSAAKKGKPLPEETRKKMSAAHKGMVFSKEWRANISKTHTGITRSEETRKKIGESNRNRVVSEETRRKLAESMRRRNTSSEMRKLVSELHIGENNPQWKGGVSFEPYCIKFNREFRERVRAFFGYKCMFPGCGHVWRRGERRLSVHHVNYDKSSCCSDVKPLFVPLCLTKQAGSPPAKAGG